MPISIFQNPLRVLQYFLFVIISNLIVHFSLHLLKTNDMPPCNSHRSSTSNLIK